MKVQAIAMGYFGKLMEVGEVFDVPDEERASWFVAVQGDEQEEVEQHQANKPKAKPKAGAHAD